MVLRRLLALSLSSCFLYAPLAWSAQASIPRIYTGQATRPTPTKDALDTALRARLASRLSPELAAAPPASFTPSSRQLAVEEEWVGRALRELYRDRGYRPIFIDARGLTRAGRDLVDALNAADAHGLFTDELLPSDAWAVLEEAQSPWAPLAQTASGWFTPQERAALSLQLASELARAPFSLSGDRWYRTMQVSLDAQLSHHDDALRSQWQRSLEERAPQLAQLEWELALALVRYARVLKLDNLYAAPGNPALDVAREHLEARGYGEDTTGTMTGAPPIPQHIREVTRSFDQWQHDELDHILAAADGQLYLTEALEQAVPNTKEYKGLQAELLRYHQIAQRGDWLAVEAFGALHEASAEQRQQLAQRLHQEGYLDTPEVPALETLEAALLLWKAHHLLPLTPEVDLSTHDALSVHVLERVAQLGLALQKLRHARYAFDAQNPHVRINIPAFRAAFWEDGEEQYHWRVIVGKAQGGGANHTPEMSAWLTEIELNPFWYPPRRLMRNSSEAGRVVPPGPRNPMGRAKFIFPNADAIYMHDTNRRELFDETTRAVSAGCVRVDNAESLAAAWIARDRGETAEEGDAFVQKRLRSGKRYRYYLREPLAVHIEYRSVYLSETGRAVFAADIYGQDLPALEERLARLRQQYPDLTPERRYDRFLRALRKHETAELR